MKAFRMKLAFRFFAIIDVMFCSKFELKAFRKNGTMMATTKFDRKEIDEAAKKGIL